MQVKREELIHIHKRIWNEIREYIRHSHGEEIDGLLFIKGRCIQDMLNENIVSQQTLKWVYRYSACVFCALFSADHCNKCPLHDCTTSESLYQLAFKGSEEACVKIRDLIYNADIPDYRNRDRINEN